jgi:hypothetical protein
LCLNLLAYVCHFLYGEFLEDKVEVEKKLGS